MQRDAKHTGAPSTREPARPRKSTVKHAIRPYFISWIRQTCSESRCLEAKEVPEI